MRAEFEHMYSRPLFPEEDPFKGLNGLQREMLRAYKELHPDATPSMLGLTAASIRHGYDPAAHHLDILTELGKVPDITEQEVLDMAAEINNLGDAKFLGFKKKLKAIPVLTPDLFRKTLNKVDDPSNDPDLESGIALGNKLTLAQVVETELIDRHSPLNASTTLPHGNASSFTKKSQLTYLNDPNPPAMFKKLLELNDKSLMERPDLLEFIYRSEKGTVAPHRWDRLSRVLSEYVAMQRPTPEGFLKVLHKRAKKQVEKLEKDKDK